jgi:hypothetical protein
VFTGRVGLSTRAASGREYIRIVDHATARFTFIPKPPGLERFQGRTVRVARDSAGRLSIQAGPEISR